MMSSSAAASDRPPTPAQPAPARTRLHWLTNLSIRWKLMGAFGALIGGIVAFQVLYFPARQSEQAKADLRSKGRSIASLVAHDVKAAFEFGDAKAVEEVFAGTSDDPDLDYLGLLDASGKRFASRGMAPGPLDAFASGDGREELNEQRLTLSLPVETAGGTRGMLVASLNLARIAARRRQDQFAVVSTGLALLAGGLLVTFVISSYVGRRLARFGRLTASVAQGDLVPGEHVLVDTHLDDEIGRLSRDLDRMVGNLRGMVHDIKEASVQVASSADEILANSRRITERAQRQAGAADETAASMEQMASSIDAVAATAQSLASHVESTSTSIAQMGASIEHVARSSATLADTVAGTYATIDEMATSIDQMAGKLERMAATASETTAPVEEVATFIAAVARSGESLAEAAQRTQATIAELALAVDDVARLATEADRFSQKASDDARAGDQAVERAIAGMRRLSDTMDNTARVITRLGSRSLEIGRIVEVIEGIADQTNLLALNAAIEAARAGEAGRGFAVVADEVRKLAERSVTATSEIGDLVRQVQQETGDAVDTAKGGVAEAKEGIALADTAGLALRSIIESVSRSSALMGRIATATVTQSKASSEALETVSHMNKIAGEVTGSVRAQSEGSRRIRQAIETINHVMSEAAQSTKEQAVGGRLVRQAVDDMNRIASQLNVATKEQADGSRIIVSSVESMNRMTREVSRATAEQRATGEGVARAVENISSMARENLSTVEETSRAIDNLVRQSEALAQLIAVFRS